MSSSLIGVEAIAMDYDIYRGRGQRQPGALWGKRQQLSLGGHKEEEGERGVKVLCNRSC